MKSSAVGGSKKVRKILVMAKQKKRLSKNAKAAKKIVSDSKALAANKAARELQSFQEFQPKDPGPQTSTAMKPRPHKKRG